jgi:hypothetical protein
MDQPRAIEIANPDRVGRSPVSGFPCPSGHHISNDSAVKVRFNAGRRTFYISGPVARSWDLGASAVEIKDVGFEQHSKEIEAVATEARRVSRYAQEQIEKIDTKKDKMPYPLAISTVLIGACLLLLFAFGGEAYVYWLITSFTTYSIYFIIMFLPVSSEKGPKKTKEEKAAGSMGAMIRKNKKLFGQMFWNVFLCDSEQMLPGAMLLFLINIFFAIFTYLAYPGEIETYYVFLIVIQSVLIIAYYWMISWRMPYSRGFSWDIQKLKLWLRGKLSSQLESERMIHALLIITYIVLFGSVLLLFLTAFLVPGMTKGKLQEQFTLTRTLVIVLLFGTQVFVFRALQGWYGKRQVRNVMMFRKKWVEEEVLPALSSADYSSPEEFAKAPKVVRFKFGRLKAQLRLAQSYTVSYLDLFGFMPLYLMAFDFEPMLREDLEVLLMRDNVLSIEAWGNRIEEPLPDLT